MSCGPRHRERMRRVAWERDEQRPERRWRSRQRASTYTRLTMSTVPTFCSRSVGTNGALVGGACPLGPSHRGTGAYREHRYRCRRAECREVQVSRTQHLSPRSLASPRALYPRQNRPPLTPIRPLGAFFSAFLFLGTASKREGHHLEKKQQFTSLFFFVFRLSLFPRNSS